MNRVTQSVDAKAEKILDAAKDVFMERGYADTSMDLVAKRAQASKTTLYTRFPSKEALFAASIERECQRHGVLLDPATFSDLSIDDALFLLGTRMLDLLWSPEALRMQQIIAGEATRSPEIVRIFYENGPAPTMAAVEGFFAAALADGKVQGGEAHFMAHQFIAAIDGSIDCEVAWGCRPPPTGAERDAYLRKVVALFLDGARRA